MIVARVPEDRAEYPAAPPLPDEFGWLADPAREYRRNPKPRGVGRDSEAREFTLRYAAALDRMALREPTAQTDRAAEGAAEALWIVDGWDENWEAPSLRPYARWAFHQWQTFTTATPGGVTGS